MDSNASVNQESETSEPFPSDGGSYSVHYAGYHILVTEMRYGENFPKLYRTRLSPSAPGVQKLLRGYGETMGEAIKDILRDITIEGVDSYNATAEVDLVDSDLPGYLSGHLEQPWDDRKPNRG
jgi:hypothetical protein